ncbi:MAG: glycosyltransferase family 92 protein [Phormidesmis sp.]
MNQTTVAVEKIDKFIVSSIRKRAVDADLFHGYHIELPSEGLMIIDGILTVAGWVVGKSAVQAIELTIDEVVVDRIPVDRSRPRLAKAFNLESAAGEDAKFGFGGDIQITEVKSDADLTVTALFADGQKYPIGTIHLKATNVDDLSDSAAKPDFIIVGAMKAATSAIYEYVTQHPKVIQRYPKELDFFSRPFNLKQGLPSYLSHFGAKLDVAQASNLIGEASPSYLFSAQSPERIKKSLPDVKLIFSLRDPVDRAISHYYHQAKRVKDEERAIEVAFGSSQIASAREIIEKVENGEMRPYALDGWDTARYLLNGYYAYGLRKWFQHFSKDQILVLNYHELESDPEHFIQTIFKFLDVDDYDVPNLNKVYANKYPEVSQALQDKIGEFYAPLNKELAEEFGIHFFSDAAFLDAAQPTLPTADLPVTETAQTPVVPQAALRNAAQMHEKNRDFLLATQAYEKLLLLLPNDAEVVAAIARLQLKLGNLETALQRSEQAAALSTDLPAWAYMTAGHTLRNLGKNERAVAEFKKAIALNSSLKVAHVAIAEISLLLQAWQDVKTHAQAALTLDDSLAETMSSYIERAAAAAAVPTQYSTAATKDSSRKKPYDLVICASVKNEAAYLLEWIAYYRALKVDHFLLYNNDSSDETTEILEALDKAGIVTHIKWPTRSGESPQISAYQDSVIRLKPQTEWVAFVDADEFIVPKHSDDLKSWLANYDDVDAIAINWKMFGSAGHTDITEGLVIEKFTACAKPDYSKNFIVKTIARVDCVEYVYAHMCKLTEGSRYVYPDHEVFAAKGGPGEHCDHSIVQINHYCTKSRVEWEVKRNKGSGSQKNRAVKRFESHFRGHDTNSEKDLSVLAFAEATRKEMEHLKSIASLSGVQSKIEADIQQISAVAALGNCVLEPDQDVEILDIIHSDTTGLIKSLSLEYKITAPILETVYSTNALVIEGWISGKAISSTTVQVSSQGQVIATEYVDNALAEKLAESRSGSPDRTSLTATSTQLEKRSFLVVLPLAGLSPRFELSIQLKTQKGRKIPFAAIRIDPLPVRKEIESYVDKGDTQGAITACENRLKFNPLYWQALKALGEIFLRQNRLEEAFDCFRQAYVISGRNSRLCHAIAVCLIKQQKIDEAVRYMEQTPI